MIAFVLSGGGNRGAVQAGALLALLERNIRPDLIIGTSVGALNGVALASNPTPEGARWIAESWRKVRRTDIFPGNSLTVGWRLLIGRGSLHAQDAFYRFVRSMLPAHVERFAHLSVPCVVTATVLNSGQLRLFGADPQERVVDAIMASTAIPPFFPPYRYGGELLVDGAVVANLPLALAIGRGALTIYALNIVDEAAPTSGSSLGETLAYALSAMLSHQDAQEQRIAGLLRRRGVTIHDVRLAVDRPRAYNDFGNSAALIAAGQRAAAAYLDAHAATRAGRLLPLLREAARAGAFMSLLRHRLLLPQRLGTRD